MRIKNEKDFRPGIRAKIFLSGKSRLLYAGDVHSISSPDGVSVFWCSVKNKKTGTPALPMSSARFQRIWVCLALLVLTGCISSEKIVARKATGLLRDVALSANRQSDIKLVEQGTPAYLLLIDGILENSRGNGDLFLAAAQAYAGYASLLG